MKVAVFSTKSYNHKFLEMANVGPSHDLFFEVLSNKVIQGGIFARLLTFPNVIITGHQAFFTKETLHNIAVTTLANITEFEQREPLENEIIVDKIMK